MFLKSNKQLADFIENTFEIGFKNNGMNFSLSDKESDITLLKLTDTPLNFMYGWNSDDDYWLISDN